MFCETSAKVTKWVTNVRTFVKGLWSERGNFDVDD